ncbi:hypothetical protein [Cyclobacterium amurskyense]|uniref:hypothetical protein n=1 Tax=Cyclobacterium amurskyense TaxID=320787 RepID=UPI0030DCE78A
MITNLFTKSINRSLVYFSSPGILLIYKCVGLFLCVYLLLFHIPEAHSQEEKQEAFSAPAAEKIYLQLTSTVFAIDQIIWFKAIVLDAQSNLPSRLSGLLYVDLIGVDGEVLLHKLVKLEQGIGEGSLELEDSYPQGRYMIRAYTKWNLNFEDDFIFSSYINIVSINGEPKEYPVIDLSIEENRELFKLKGVLGLGEIGEALDREIQVYLDWGEGRDTVIIKRNREGQYPLSYDLEREQSWVSLSFDVEEKLQFSKTVYLNDALPDIQFFPESGHLVHGFGSKVAFKAIGSDGKGIKIEGTVYDGLGNKVTDFKSNVLGMGVLYLQPDSLANYHARVSLPNVKDSTKVYPLPKVMANGTVLSVAKFNEKLRLALASNELEDSVFISASCRGVDYFLIEGKLKEGQLVSTLPADQLPEGIIIFTVKNHAHELIVQRLYYNDNSEQKLDVSLEIDKNSYRQREQTKLHIKISGYKTKAPASSISVMVVNDEHGTMGKENNIRSYFLLSSELKGEVEDPGFYFNEENSERHEAMEALMLTQGWRSYNYPVSQKRATIIDPQQGLTLSGKVLPPVLGRKNSVNNINLTLASFGNKSIIYSQTTDSTGNFFFLLDDAYGQRMRVLLKANDRLGKEKRFSFSLDSIKTPKIYFQNLPLSAEVEHNIKETIQSSNRRIKAEENFNMLNGFNDLEEVLVEDFLLSPEMEAAHKSFGQPDFIIPGGLIREKEEKWSYGLFSILMFNFSDQVMIEQFSDGFMLAHVLGGKDEPTLLAIDGKLLEKDLYDLVPHMSPDIIDQIEIIKHAKFFKKQYLTVFPETNPLEAPYMGHIISVYTKDRIGVLGLEKPSLGTLDTVLPVFSPKREFYTPKYKSPDARLSQKPDLRSLIHWDSNLKIGAEGAVSVDFYNGDVLGDHMLIIEAISEDGRFGYQKKKYQVIP